MNYQKGTFCQVPNIHHLHVLSGYAQAVYLHICNFADEKGCCWPSRGKLAKLVKVCVRTIDRCNAELIEKGFIAKQLEFNPDGSPNSNIYQILLIEINKGSSDSDAPGVGTQVHQGSAGDAPGVVQEMHGGSDSDDTLTIPNDPYPLDPYVGSSSDEENPPSKDFHPPEKRKKFESDSIQIQLSKFLFKQILKNDPSHTKPNFQVWAKSIDFMLRIDKRTSEEIREIIIWVQTNSFWHSNILSTSKLRAKFNQLKLKMNGGLNAKNNNTSGSKRDEINQYANEKVERAGELFTTYGNN